MPKSKERKKHLLLAILFFAIAIWMIFYYLYPLFVVGHRFAGPIGFDAYRIENVILAIVIPFIVFVSSILLINFNLMKCDYFCKHDGWWGLLTALSVMAMIGGLFLGLPPMNFIVFFSQNLFFTFVSLEILGVDMFVLSRIAKKRRKIQG